MNTTKLWRTLVRVELVLPRVTVVCIPAYNAKLGIVVDNTALPDFTREDGTRFHCMVNIGASNPDKLVLEGPFEP